MQIEAGQDIGSGILQVVDLRSSGWDCYLIVVVLVYAIVPFFPVAESIFLRKCSSVCPEKFISYVIL